MKTSLLKTLLEISRKMNSSVELDEILTGIVEIAKEYIGVSRVSVFLMEGDVLRLSAYAGFTPGRTSEVPVGEGITGGVASTGKRVVVNHGESNSNEYSATSFLSIPILSGHIVSGQQVTGVLNLTDKSNDFFDAEDLQISEYIASQCALAVERNTLYNRIKHSERLQTVGLLRASIVHDIRNMLGIVETYLALVEEDPTVDTIDEYFTAIRSEISRVQNLADDMLDYSKNEITLHARLFYIDDLCRQVAKDMNMSLIYTDVKVVCESRGHIEIFADEERLYRVLFNLVNNGVAAINDGGKVRIRVREANGYVYITVADNGKGIPASKINSIYEPFQGFDKAKSTGLGLVIVRDIVKAHGGTIKARSAEGRYTAFRLKLPA